MRKRCGNVVLFLQTDAREVFASNRAANMFSLDQQLNKSRVQASLVQHKDIVRPINPELTHSGCRAG